MAKVTLPFGYKSLSGGYEKSVIYQGNVCKVYNVAKDPRTTAQMENRYLWGDIRRLLKSMGAFGKAACRSRFGKAYVSNVYNYIRQDLDNYWWGANNSWQQKSETEKQPWRDYAPCQSTWNDPGYVFYTVNYMLDLWRPGPTNFLWGMGATQLTDAEAAAEWWGKGYSDYVPEGISDDNHAAITYYNSWNTDAGSAGYYNGGIHFNLTQVGPVAEFYWLGRRLVIGYMGNIEQGDVDVNIDNLETEVMHQYRAHVVYRSQWVSPLLTFGLHHCRLEVSTGGKAVIDYLVVFKGSSMKSTPWIPTGHKYNFSAVWPFGLDNETYFSPDGGTEYVLCLGGENDFAGL